jgi:hypothetical protein
VTGFLVTSPPGTKNTPFQSVVLNVPGRSYNREFLCVTVKLLGELEGLKQVTKASPDLGRGQFVVVGEKVG